jgi:hypothetical protein
MIFTIVKPKLRKLYFCQYAKNILYLHFCNQKRILGILNSKFTFKIDYRQKYKQHPVMWIDRARPASRL